MKKTLFPLNAALTLACATSAQTKLTPSTGVTTNYLWHGVTQTGDEAVALGGIDYSHASGLYLGTWALSIDLLGKSNIAEVDFYIGYAGKFSKKFGYNTGFIYDHYPSDEYDGSGFSELYTGLSYDSLSSGFTYTGIGGKDTHICCHPGAYCSIAENWNLGGIVGYYDFGGGSTLDYAHGQIDLTRKLVTSPAWFFRPRRNLAMTT